MYPHVFLLNCIAKHHYHYYQQQWRRTFELLLALHVSIIATGLQLYLVVFDFFVIFFFTDQEKLLEGIREGERLKERERKPNNINVCGNHMNITVSYLQPYSCRSKNIVSVSVCSESRKPKCIRFIGHWSTIKRQFKLAILYST